MDYNKAGYLLDDFRLFHLNEKQLRTMEYHYHDFYKLFFLISGSGAYSIEGIRYNITDGDLIFVGKHQIHRPEFDSEFSYERVIIYIHPDFLDRHCDEECGFKKIFNGTWGHLLRPNESQLKIFNQLIRLLEEELKKEYYGRAIMSNAILMQILVNIIRDIQNIDTTLPDSTPTFSKRTVEILKYIEQNISEEITIDILAEHFYVSKYHMMRSFKEETGQSIHNYITERRLLLAKSLISKGLSATDSCYQAGFKNYSSFTRAFGKHFGTTPTGRIELSSRLDETYE